MKPKTKRIVRDALSTFLELERLDNHSKDGRVYLCDGIYL